MQRSRDTPASQRRAWLAGPSSDAGERRAAVTARADGGLCQPDPRPARTGSDFRDDCSFSSAGWDDAASRTSTSVVSPVGGPPHKRASTINQPSGLDPEHPVPLPTARSVTGRDGRASNPIEKSAARNATNGSAGILQNRQVAGGSIVERSRQARSDGSERTRIHIRRYSGPAWKPATPKEPGTITTAADTAP